MFKATYEVTAFLYADTMEEAIEMAESNLIGAKCNLGIIAELKTLQPWGSSLETE